MGTVTVLTSDTALPGHPWIRIRDRPRTLELFYRCTVCGEKFHLKLEPDDPPAADLDRMVAESAWVRAHLHGKIPEYSRDTVEAFDCIEDLVNRTRK